MWAAFLARLTARRRVRRAEPAIDGTFVPQKRGARRPAKSGRGLGTRVMLVTAEGGVPVHAALYPARRNEGAVAAEVMGGVPAPPRTGRRLLLADRMYDGDNWRDRLAGLGYEPVCRHRKNRVRPKRRDGRVARRLRRRRRIEATFARLKAYRGVATRYVRRAGLYLAAVRLLCGLICLRHF